MKSNSNSDSKSGLYPASASFISKIACFIFILLAMGASSKVRAIPRTDTEALYSESIYMHQDDQETPSAFESSARLTEESDDVDYYSTATDTVDLEPVQISEPTHGKKLSARRNTKKSSRN